MRHVSSLRSSPSTTDNRGPSAKHDPSAYTLAILGDLHLDPRYMDDHVVGQKHLKLKLSLGSSTFEAMRFGSADAMNTSIDAVFRPSINEFRGQSTLQLVLDYVA